MIRFYLTGLFSNWKSLLYSFLLFQGFSFICELFIDGPFTFYLFSSRRLLIYWHHFQILGIHASAIFRRLRMLWSDLLLFESFGNRNLWTAVFYGRNPLLEVALLLFQAIIILSTIISCFFGRSVVKAFCEWEGFFSLTLLPHHPLHFLEGMVRLHRFFYSGKQYFLTALRVLLDARVLDLLRLLWEFGYYLWLRRYFNIFETWNYGISLGNLTSLLLNILLKTHSLFNIEDVGFIQPFWFHFTPF